MPTALEELSSISQILSAANHRNKNQHRLGKWWKAFSVLRRNVIRLVSELETLSANEERLGETKKTIASREVVEKRCGFMVQWVVPKCYLAFSGLVADNQYSNLGLMLMGTLARILEIMKPLMKEGMEEPKNMNENPDEAKNLVGQNVPDFGEVLKRGEAENLIAASRGANEDLEDSQEVNSGLKKGKRKRKGMEKITVEEPGDQVSDSLPTKVKKKKKKKKTGDAFDDLFGSL